MEMKNLSEKSDAYYKLNKYYEIFSQAEDYPKFILKELEKISKNKVILDAGCGSGKFISDVQHLAKKIYGVDASLEQLDTAKKKVTSDVELICCDLKKLPFDDNTFDVVYCAWVLGTILDKNKRITVLNELIRVLKKQGKLILVENNIGGEFEIIRDRYPDVKKTEEYNNWIINHGFKEYKKISTYFLFKNIKIAKKTFEVIYGKEISQKVSNRINHEIIIYKYINL